MNPILSLGLVRMVLALALDISRTLGVDAGRHAKWQHILAHLSAYPTFEPEGKTVFRLSEEGYAWHGDNTLAIQHIYPAGGLGLDSDPALLAVARQTIDARFGDLRAHGAFLVSAARAGGEVGPVRIVSEKGRLCGVENPWPGRSVRLTRDGEPAEVLSGPRLSFSTCPSETIILERR